MSPEQCFFNSTLDPLNGQTANFTLKTPKVIESPTYVKVHIILEGHKILQNLHLTFDWLALHRTKVR